MRTVLTLLLLLASAVSQAVEPRLEYFDGIKAPADSVVILPGGEGVLSTTIEVRYSAGSMRNAGLSKNFVEIVWGYESPDSYWHASVRGGCESLDEAVDTRFVLLSVARRSGGRDSLVFEKSIDASQIDIRKTTVFVAEITRGSVSFAAGPGKVVGFGGIDSGGWSTAPCGITVRGKARLEMLARETVADMASSLVLFPAETCDSLERALKGRRQPEGIWQYLDRDTDSRLALSGGRYRLAVMKNNTGDAYDIIYLGGAEVNSRSWRPGMKKGELRTTIFTGHYDLVWYDSAMDAITLDANASIEQDAILTLSFPLLKSTLRFARVR